MEAVAGDIREAAGPTIAREQVERLRSKCQLVADTPGEISTMRPELGEGIRSFPVPPHVLYFRYRDSVVQIIRILHERQDVEQAFTR